MKSTTNTQWLITNNQQLLQRQHIRIFHFPHHHIRLNTLHPRQGHNLLIHQSFQILMIKKHKMRRGEWILSATRYVETGIRKCETLKLKAGGNGAADQSPIPGALGSLPIIFGNDDLRRTLQ